MSALALLIISPLGAALVLAATAVLLTLIRWRRCSLGAAALAFSWLWLWSTPAASLALRGNLEDRFPPVSVESLPAAQAIVVLGGAMSAAGPGRPLPDLSGAADRVWHAARLFHAGKAPWVVFSGASDPEVSTTSEAEAMRVFVRDLGVPESAVLLEPDSHNTRENAAFTAKLLRDRKIDRVLLVTSALHMRRALAHFRAQGLTVIPAATDYTAPRSKGAPSWLPDAGSLEGSERALKEIVAGWAWRLTAKDAKAAD